jgi:hypothetical protein
MDSLLKDFRSHSINSKNLINKAIKSRSAAGNRFSCSLRQILKYRAMRKAVIIKT